MNRDGIRLALICGFLAFSSPSVANDDEEPRIAEPVNDPGEWVGPSDYPVLEGLNGKTGVTSFKLQIDSGGRPVTCEVTNSSGVPALDTKTCETVLARARFKRAKDRNGRFVNSVYSNKVRWVLPGVAPVNHGGPAKMVIEVILTPQGVAEDCKIMVKEGAFGTMPDPCADDLQGVIIPPDPDRPKIRMRLIQTIEFELAP